MGRLNIPQSIRIALIRLVIASTLLQLVALLGVLPIEGGSAGRQWFSTVEMLLVLLLVAVSLSIRRWSRTQSLAVRQTSSLCLASLLCCAGGDFINRNYFGDYYQWDAVIRHSYLIEAIAFFFPGYLLILIANRRITRDRVSARLVLATLTGGMLIGLLAFLPDYRTDVHPLASLAILAYTLLLSAMAASALWLIATFGWAASRIAAIGIVLAPLADALIAKFWIYSDHFPVIEHANWIIYYASLAMIQTLPFLLAVPEPDGPADCSTSLVPR